MPGWWLAGWPPGWLAGWLGLAGWLAWLARCWLAGCIYYMIMDGWYLMASSQPAKPASQASQGQPEQPATSQQNEVRHANTIYGSGVRGQAFKNHTGLENEVGTPRQLLDVANIFRCSYIGGKALCPYIYHLIPSLPDVNNHIYIYICYYMLF